MNVAHVEASQVVPLCDDPLERGDVCEEVTEDITKESPLENLTQKGGRKNVKDFRKIRSYRYRVMD